jgi:hypothetical protein
MPLIHSSSKEALGENIKELQATGKYPHKQVLAIALENQRRAQVGKAERLYSSPAKEMMAEHLRLLGEMAGLPKFKKEFKDQAGELHEINDALAKGEPTEAQIEAGNYKKGHRRMHGLDITIENAEGTIRRGTDRDGNAWAVKMPYDYGYFRGLGRDGADGDAMDVAVGPEEENEEAHVINQLDPETGEFDEHKTFIGFPSREAAIEAFKAGRNDNPEKVLGEVITVPISELKRWLDEGEIQDRAILKCFEEFAKAEGHVKSFYRHVNGKTIYIHDFNRESHGHHPEASLHQRTVLGQHDTKGHYLRVTDAEDKKAILATAKDLGIQPGETRRAGAFHHGRHGAYDHIHFKEEDAKRLHDALQHQDWANAHHAEPTPQEPPKNAFQEKMESLGWSQGKEQPDTYFKNFDLPEGKQFIASIRNHPSGFQVYGKLKTLGPSKEVVHLPVLKDSYQTLDEAFKSVEKEVTNRNGSPLDSTQGGPDTSPDPENGERKGEKMENLMEFAPKLSKPIEKLYLNVPFSEKDKAKQEGAKWDGDAKKWYWPGDNLPASLEEYKSQNNTSQVKSYEDLKDLIDNLFENMPEQIQKVKDLAIKTKKQQEEKGDIDTGFNQTERDEIFNKVMAITPQQIAKMVSDRISLEMSSYNAFSTKLEKVKKLTDGIIGSVLHSQLMKIASEMQAKKTEEIKTKANNIITDAANHVNELKYERDMKDKYGHTHHIFDFKGEKLSFEVVNTMKGLRADLTQIEGIDKEPHAGHYVANMHAKDLNQNLSKRLNDEMRVE